MQQTFTDDTEYLHIENPSSLGGTTINILINTHARTNKNNTTKVMLSNNPPKRE